MIGGSDDLARLAPPVDLYPQFASRITTAARRLPSLRLAVPVEEVRFKNDSVVRGPAALPVAWDEVLP